MLKNIIRIVGMIIGCITIIISSYAYAEVIQVSVEIPCSPNPIAAPWVTFDGEPEVQYSLTTNGLLEDRKEGVVEIVKIGSLSRTPDGLYVYVGARCIPTDVATNISLTGSTLTCNVGEGIKVSMLEPNNRNPDKYRYSGKLTITRDEKKEGQEVSVVNATTVYDSEVERLLFDTKVIVLNPIINSF